MGRHAIAIILVGVLVACSGDNYTMNDFNTVPKIDTHIHLNAESTVLSELAKEDNFTLLTVNVDAPRTSLDEQYRLALHHTEKNPDQVKFVSAFDLKEWDSADWADQTIAKLKTSFEDGALGIKIWKNIGMVYKDSTGKFIMIDDPKFDPVISYVIGAGKTVFGHLGEPKNCWLPLEQMTVNNDRNYFRDHPEYHMFLHPDYPSYDDQINARDRFLERHPDLMFHGAHLGSLEWNLDELAKRLDKFPKMAVDVAARIPHLQYLTIQDREDVRQFFIKYQDRLTYGTDSGISANQEPDQARKELHDTWIEDWKYFVTDEKMTVGEVNGEFTGLKLPKGVVDKFYRENAKKWFKM